MKKIFMMNLLFRLLLRNLVNQLQQLKTDDAVISFNFRPDRAIQLSRAFTDESLTSFNTR